MYEDAKRELTEDRAVVVSIDQREFTDAIIVHRKWENVPKEAATGYIEYLDSETRSIVDPTGVPTGTYKVLRNTYVVSDEGEGEIHQYLAVNLHTTAPYAALDTQWRLFQGIDYHSGSSKLVLEMPDFDPAFVREVSEALPLTPNKFTNGIYTLSDGLIEGTWYNRMAVYSIDERGVGILRWYLSRYFNQDLYFPYQASTTEKAADFHKIHMPPDTVQTFFEQYYFDTDAVYVSTDGGTNYISKNGVTESGVVPATADRLDTVVSGRIVQLTENPNEETDEITLLARITWATDGDESGFIYRPNRNTVVTDVELHNVTEVRRDDFLRYTYIDSSGNWYYSTDGINYTVMNGVTSSGLIPSMIWTISGEDQYNEGRSVQIATSYNTSKDRWVVQVNVTQAKLDERISLLLSDTRLGIRSNPDSTLKIDKGVNVSETVLRQAENYYDGACPVGTIRRLEVTPLGDGLYNYEALEVTSEPVTAAFRIGKGTTYFGANYPLEPTTNLILGTGADPWVLNADGNITNSAYILIGGTSTSTTDISSDADVNESIGREEDGTWSWRIKVNTPAEAVNFGAEDPDLETSRTLIKYGIPEDEWHWVGRYLYDDIPTNAAGTICLVGEYVTITDTLGEFGTHGDLTGRRMIMGQLRNERIVDGRISYDVYKRIITADIEDDDGWFFMGANEGIDRNKKTLASLVTSPTYTTAVASGGTETILDDEAHVFSLLENATKRRQTVKRERKYFVRRPRLTDLTSAGILSLMTSVANPCEEPDSFYLETFDVIKLGPHTYAVERLTVQSDEDVYPDEDAVTRYYAEGEPACFRQEIPISDIEEVW